MFAQGVYGKFLLSLLLPQKTKANKEFSRHKDGAQHAAGRHQLAPKLWLVHQSLRITEFRRRVTRRHAETPWYKGRRVCIAACVHSSSTDVVTSFSCNLHTTEKKTIKET